MDTAFFAMMSRLKLIDRWSLMRNTSAENVMEHSYQVASLSHALVLIRNKYFSEDRPVLDPGEVVCLALYHDAGEIITGDMPTPIKYQTEELRQAYSLVEDRAVTRLLAMLPEDFREDYTLLLTPDMRDEKTKAAHQVMKAADSLCAYLKCVEEVGLGNREFSDALKETHQKLKHMALPELDYFLERFVPAFYLSLDELQQ